MTDFLRIYWPLLALTFAGLAFAISKVEPSPPKKIVFAAGAEGGSYHALADQYANILAKSNITIDIIETNGSIENSELLNNGHVDIGWVQGGLNTQTHAENLQALGGMYYEPFWVFVRSEAAISRFSQLRDLNVAIGIEGSGTRALTLDIQREFGGFWSAESKLAMTSKAARDALIAGTIDAAIFVTSGRTPFFTQLMRNPDLELLSISETKGLARRHPGLEATVLYQGVVDPGAPTPPTDIEVVATIAQLVVHKDLHPAIQSLLLQAATEIHTQGSALSDPGDFPKAYATDLALSRQAKNFYQHGPTFLQRIFPFAVANFFERAWILAIPILTLMIPLIRVAPPIYRWRTRRKIYVWYEDLRTLEAKGRAALTKAEKSEVKTHLNQLQAEIGNLDVPLSYTDDLYRLRSHVAFVTSLVDGAPLNQLEQTILTDSIPDTDNKNANPPNTKQTVIL